ncbi:MAG: CmcI family methyltransferase [Pseudomonadota bacterium]
MKLRTPTEPVPEYVLRDLRRTYMRIAANEHWYQQSWMGVPVWQLPDDLVRLQRIVWDLKPSLIIETGTKFGGLTLFFASLLDMLHGDENAGVVSIDIDILPEATQNLSEHRFAHRVLDVIEGDATAPATMDVMRRHRDATDGPCLVALDDDHNREHVIQELDQYGDLLRPGDMLIVFDTVFAHLGDTPIGTPSQKYPDMMVSNPAAALRDWLETAQGFEAVTDYFGYGVSYFEGGVLRKV